MLQFFENRDTNRDASILKNMYATNMLSVLAKRCDNIFHNILKKQSGLTSFLMEFLMESSMEFHKREIYRSVFRSESNIYDGFFCKNS